MKKKTHYILQGFRYVDADLAINQEIKHKKTLLVVYSGPRGYAHQSFTYRTYIININKELYFYRSSFGIYLTTQVELPTLHGQFSNNQ